MVYHSVLVGDLGLILMAAALVILVFHKLKQPIVLGYLIAGLLVGPHISFVPTVSDVESIKVWAEIGVIFLLFGLGLEFSFKKLVSVGRPATTTAFFEIVFMIGAGYLVGQFLDWSQMDSLFLGGILSISSTTIIVRAFQEVGVKGQKFASLVFGILIVEDLLAILLLVLLSTVAVTQTLSGLALMEASLKLGFFLVLWFLVGIYLIPLFLEKARNLLDDESVLVVSLGLCLSMVTIASAVGFSPALGAFVMGSILAETSEGKRIEHILVPVRDLFAAVFFVSVGMLIDPRILIEYWDVILLVTVVTIIGKFLSSSLGSLIAGKSLKESVKTGMSLAQIGEFSFIIATLGMTLKVTSEFLYPVAVAVSAVTTFTTPYQIKYADVFYHWLDRKIPLGIKMRLQKYEEAMATPSPISVWKIVIAEFGLKIVLNIIIIAAIAIAMSQYGEAWIVGLLGSGSWIRFATSVLTFLFCAPFLWGVLMSHPAIRNPQDSEMLRRTEQLQFGIFIFRFLIGTTLVIAIISQFYSIGSLAAGVLIIFAFLGFFFLSRFAEPLYRSIEERFLSNLHEKDLYQIKSQASAPRLAPWNATLREFVIPANCEWVGRSLLDTRMKEQFGVMIVMMERGRQVILAPDRSQILYPNDRIYVIGEEAPLDELSQFLIPPKELEEPLGHRFGLDVFMVTTKNSFLNQTIRESQIRELIKGLVVGVERNQTRILNPDSEFIFREGDLVWAVGNIDEIKKLK